MSVGMGRRESILREIGVGPLWRLRARDAERAQAAQLLSVAPGAAPAAAGMVREALVPESVPESARPSPAALSRPARRPESVLPPAAPVRRQASPEAAAGVADPARRARIAGLDWDALEGDIRDCKACVLCERRKQAVPGVGDRNGELMLVGEGPGAEEDQRGEPFVGQAGRLLDNMLAAIGQRRGDGVYIANAVKCRPPHNRTPEAGEIAACLPYLERQVQLVRPRLLVALGRPAAQALLRTEVSIAGARGKLFEYQGTPVVVTYHPAYLLRNPYDKAKAWEDLCFIRRTLERKG